MDNLITTIHHTLSRFNLGIQPKLQQIADIMNIQSYKPGHKVLTMRHTEPSFTARVYASGTVTIWGCRSEDDCMDASQILAGLMGLIYGDARVHDFKVTTIKASCQLPFNINLEKFANAHKNLVRYEPERDKFARLELATKLLIVNVYGTGALVCFANTKDKIDEGFSKVFELALNQ